MTRILDAHGNIVSRSSNTSEIKEQYIQSVKEQMFADGIVNNHLRSMKIYNNFGIPTQYIAVIQRNKYNAGPISFYLISITKEVYSWKSYLAVLRFSGYLFLVVISLAGVTAYLFSCYITKPVLQITDTATHISKLDFTKKCTYHNQDELGMLAQGLNDMSEILCQTITQLENAKERLEEEMEMQKEFIADVSHEFKTPLTIIRGYIEILSEKEINKAIKEEVMQTIMNEVDRMDKLVYDLLNLSKLESEGYELKRNEISCVQLLQNVITSYEMIMKNKNIVFMLDYEEDLGTIMADQYCIEQVIRNYLSNAIAHAQPQKKLFFLPRNRMEKFIYPFLMREIRLNHQRFIGFGISFIAKIKQEAKKREEQDWDCRYVEKY